MGLSRRRFTRNFRVGSTAATNGVSLAEFARELEVNPKVLHRGRDEFRQGARRTFPGQGKP